MADPQKLPPHAAAALRHLRRVKPEDGWSADTYLSSRGRRMVRLKRRRRLPGLFKVLCGSREPSGSYGFFVYNKPTSLNGRKRLPN